MKKKIIVIMIMLSMTFTFFLNVLKVSAEEIEFKEITDETTIEEDFNVMGLNFSEYIVEGDYYDRLLNTYYENGYIEQFVVAVGENYSRGKENIISYIYVYSPLLFYGDVNIILDITLNDNFYASIRYNNAYNEMELVKQNEKAGIACFKLELFKKTDLVRTYEISCNNEEDVEPFKAIYKTEFDGNVRLDYFSTDSMIYITNDVVVPVVIHNDSYWLSYRCIAGDIGTLLQGKNPYKNTVMYFYNFSANKKIDKIISATMSWDDIHHTEMYGMLGTSASVNTNVVKKRQEPFKVGKNKFQYYGEEIILNNFTTPAVNRMLEFPKSFQDKMSEEEKKQFSDYDHSILFASGEWYDENTNKSRLLVDNVSLTKLVYETDGVIYSSIVVDGDGNDSPTDPIVDVPPSNVNIFEEMMKALTSFFGGIWNNILSFFKPYMWVFWVILGLICFGLLCKVLSLLVSVGGFVGMIFYILLMIITFPIQLLMAPFKRKKRKKNNA